GGVHSQDDLPPLTSPYVRVYIVRCQRPTYVHWAIRAVHPDGAEQQISLSRNGLHAVIAYEEPEGELREEVPPGCWTTAVSLVGEPWEYNAEHNCTHLIQNITGVPLPNTGISLIFGIGALALVAAGTAQALKGAFVQRQ
nr:2A [Kobuvirus cattle/Kagoshima-1-22-KoV/2014/JPN]